MMLIISLLDGSHPGTLCLLCRGVLAPEVFKGIARLRAKACHQHNLLEAQRCITEVECLCGEKACSCRANAILWPDSMTNMRLRASKPRSTQQL